MRHIEGEPEKDALNISDFVADIEGVISSGYDELDLRLGGGLVRGSTNLVVESSGCTGHVFLLDLLAKRVTQGDIGLVDCFFTPPETLVDECMRYNINLSGYNGNLHFVDLTSSGKIQAMLGTSDLNTFADQYVRMVCNMIPHNDIFNVVLSLTAFTEQFTEKAIYAHLAEDLKVYESYKRTALYLINRDSHSPEFIDDLKKLANAVIVLAQDNADDRILHVEKSPLPNQSKLPLHYYVNRGGYAMRKLL